MSARHRRKLGQLSPDDAATLRDLRAAALAATPRRYRHPAPTTVQRLAASAANSLRQLATATAYEDVERLLRTADWLEECLPKDSQRDELPVLPAGSTTSDPKDVLNAWMRDAHAAGYTFEAIAEVIGVTRERVRQLVAKAKDDLQSIPPVVGATVADDLPWPTIPKPWHRWPRPTLSKSEERELLELHRLGSQLRGKHPADDPRRAASEELTARMACMVNDRGFTYREVGELLGITVQGVRMRLTTHGYRNAPPSLKHKVYQGEHVAPRTAAS